MGHGDFKLLAVLGAWFGWQLLPLIIILSSLVGAVIGISLMVFKSHSQEYSYTIWSIPSNRRLEFNVMGSIYHVSLSKCRNLRWRIPYVLP